MKTIHIIYEKQLINKLKEKFLIGSSASITFTYVGLSIKSYSDGITIDQTQYISSLNTIPVSKDRISQKKSQLLESEIVKCTLECFTDASFRNLPNEESQGGLIIFLRDETVKRVNCDNKSLVESLYFSKQVNDRRLRLDVNVIEIMFKCYTWPHNLSCKCNCNYGYGQYMTLQFVM